MLIKNLLEEMEDTFFVGRHSELQVMNDYLLNSKNPWKLLHIHGPGGIGKTSLLQAFMRKGQSSNIFYLDGKQGFKNPHDFLTHLHSLLPTYIKSLFPIHNEPTKVEQLNSLLPRDSTVILLFDTFEKWGPIEDWVRLNWLPELHSRVRVCTAGRYPLQGEWRRGGWQKLVDNITLAPLKAKEAETLINAYGIYDKPTIKQIQKICNGLPLAYSLSCQIVERDGIAELMKKMGSNDNVQSLTRILLEDIEDSKFAKYLDAASILWRFNQEILEYIVSEEIDNLRFQDFCSLPYINYYHDSWRIHDTIKHWVSIDFKQRRPEAYAQYQIKALEFLKIKGTISKSNSNIDKLYLLDNDLVQDYFHKEDETKIETKYAEERDIPTMTTLYKEYASVIHPVYEMDNLNLETFFHSLWKKDNKSFITLWKGDQLVSFYSYVLLQEEVMDILTSIPITCNYVTERLKKPIDCPEYILWICAFKPQLEQEMSRIMSRDMVMQITDNMSLINITPLQEWFPILLAIGFDFIPWGDYTTASGIQYKAFQMLSNANSGIDKILIEQYYPGSKDYSIEEAILLIKKGLKHFHQLNLVEEDFQSFASLLRQWQSIEAQSLEEIFQDIVYKMLDKLSQGSKDDILYGQIINLAFVKNIGSHEIVAERLQLPLATYYRYLKKSLNKLGQYFLSGDSKK